VTRLDWILLAFVALTALGGLRTGLVATVLSLAGLLAGAVLGARVAPGLVSAGVRSEYKAVLALGGAIAGALLLRWAAGVVGSFLRGGLRLMPPLRVLDSVGGLAAGALWGLALVWVAGVVALELPRGATVRREVARSQLLQRLNELAPPPDLLKLDERLRL
jgi:uncharacterized membrane protein required for colicin V production